MTDDAGDHEGTAAAFLRRVDFMPDPAFEARATDFAGGVAYPAEYYLGWNQLYSGALDDRVLGTTPLRDVGYATLFAYMHRRFGPPGQPGDPYKDLSASWLLTTPDPDAHVLVRPSVSGAWHCFVPFLVSGERPSNLGVTDPRVHRIAAAYRATLLDLLRPVGVRDSSIDARGIVGEHEPCIDGPPPVEDDVGDAEGVDADAESEDEDEGFEDDEEALHVEHHPSSGTSIPPEMVTGDGWGDLVGLVGHLGGGDIAAGRALAIGILADAVLGRFADLPREARILARARLSVLRRGDMSVRVPLDDDGARDADAFAGRIQYIVYKGGGDDPLLSDGNVEASSRVMAAVGIGDELRKGIDRARFEFEWVALSNGIMEAVGDGFDSELLPTPRNDIAAFARLLHDRGHGTAATLAAESLSTEHGRDVLRMALYAIDSHLRARDVPKD